MAHLFFNVFLNIIPSLFFYALFLFLLKRIKYEVKNYFFFQILLLFWGFFAAYCLSLVNAFVLSKVHFIQLKFNLKSISEILLEEFTKTIFLGIFLAIFKPYFQGKYVSKSIILGIAFGMGFGIYENILFAAADPILSLKRALSSNIIHVICSVFIIYYLIKSLEVQDVKMFRGLFFAIIIHFFFNTISSFNTQSFIAFLVLIILISILNFESLIKQDIKWIKYESSNSL